MARSSITRRILNTLIVSASLGFSCFQALAAQSINVDGRPFLGLSKVGEHFGMRGYWVEQEKVFRLASKYTHIDFTKNSRFTQINGMPVYLGFSTAYVDGHMYMAATDYQHVLKPILTPQSFDNKPRVRRIVIDVGHGGKDTGARNERYGLTEKELNLDVAFRLRRLLEKSGFEVKMTRSKDVFVQLEERSLIANRYKADFFISLHFNSAASPNASGLEVFALTPQNQPSTQRPRLLPEDAERFWGNRYDPWNVLAAYHVERALVQGIDDSDRGVKRARFSVLKYLNCPGVLVELGFMSHVGTAKKLRSKWYREQLAKSLYEGILAYRERLDRIR